MSIDTEAIRADLLRRRSDLLTAGAGSAVARGAVELDQSRVGRLSRTDALQQQAMALASAQRRQTGIVRIDAALARLARGGYGFCTSCDEAIAPARLAHDPATPVCIDCAGGERT